MPSPVALRPPAPGTPDSDIPLSNRPWSLGAVATLYLGLALGAAWMVLDGRRWTLQLYGTPLDPRTSRAMFGLVAAALALLATNAGLTLASLGRLVPLTIAFRQNGLTLPTTRFLRGVTPVRVPWSEVRDVSLRQTGTREVVDIETTSRGTITLPGELTTREWRPARIAEAIQQEATRR